MFQCLRQNMSVDDQHLIESLPREEMLLHCSLIFTVRVLVKLV